MNSSDGRRKTISLVASLLLFSALAGYCGSRESVRPSTWARPIEIDGVPNLHKVSDTLFRSGQPSPEGLKALAALGIKTIINLRSMHPAAEETASAGLNYVEIPSRATSVKKADVLRFLAAVTESSGGPYLVHCHHGADRAGLMVAAYRVVVQNWTKEEAIREMKTGGYGFHSVYSNIVRFIRRLDAAEYRKALAKLKKNIDSAGEIVIN